MADITFFVLYGVLAVGLTAAALAAMRNPDDRAWLRRRGWLIVTLIATSIIIGVLARLV